MPTILLKYVFSLELIGAKPKELRPWLCAGEGMTMKKCHGIEMNIFNVFAHISCQGGQFELLCFGLKPCALANYFCIQTTRWF